MQSGKGSDNSVRVDIGLTHRWNEIQELWQQHQWLYTIGGFLAGLLVAPLIASLGDDAMLFLKSLVPEAVGIAFTVLFINALDKNREDARRRRELQERLVRDAGSPVTATAVNAIRELRAHGWLSGDKGLLQGVDLQRTNMRDANLSGANLSDAIMSNAHLEDAHLLSTNLSGAYLSHAHLEGVNLSLANLQSSYLSNADLRYAKLMEADLTNANLTGATLASADLVFTKLCGADLSMANLTNADLLFADLTDADLAGADLSGADLSEARLTGADLSFAVFDLSTRLPNGLLWTRDTDLTRFGAKVSQRSAHTDTGIFASADDETRRFNMDSIEAVRRQFERTPISDETQEVDIAFAESADDLDAWQEDDLELFGEFFENVDAAELDDASAPKTGELAVGEFHVVDVDVAEDVHETGIDETVDSQAVEPYLGDLEETKTDITLRGDLDMSLFKGVFEDDTDIDDLQQEDS